MRKIAVGFLLFLALVAQLAFGQPVPIANSKHNLSAAVTNTNTIKAAAGGTTEICVFCHTPHGSVSTAQLWNRTSSAATYTMYGSDYLGAAGFGGVAYITAAEITALAPNAKSKLCLSCHDGTVALGSVYNLPGSGGYSITPGAGIPMAQSGVTIADGKMPATATGYLGTSLTDDHPVGYLYKPGTGAGQDPELAAYASVDTRVRLDPNNSGGTVECHTCHNAHDNQYTKFLRMSNANAGLCTTCHTKKGYATVSGHQAAGAIAQAYRPLGAASSTTVAEYSCRSCHRPHSAQVKQLLRGAEENTCYERGCHGANTIFTDAATPATPALRNIQLEMGKTPRVHPTNATSAAHKDLPFVTGGTWPTSGGAELPDALGNLNRHAECPDCHNPHQAQPAAADKSTRDGPVAGPRVPLRISLALKGTWGVQPNWPAPTGTVVLTALTTNLVTLAPSTAFTPVGVTPAGVISSPALTDEYQVCMKCHSDYVTLPGTTRDIARQINPLNSSYHGIVPCAVNVTPSTTNGQLSGCTTNFFVNQNTMVQPWAGTSALTNAQAEACRVSPGTCATFAASRARVWCSDCHGSESSAGVTLVAPFALTAKAAPYGAHGSTNNGTGPGGNTDKMLIRTIVNAALGVTPLCVACHISDVYTGVAGTANSRYTAHGTKPEYLMSGCFTCHMWEAGNAQVGTATASGKIFPHGMNKRWAATFPFGAKATATTPSGQMVDAFVGGSAQLNIDYVAKKCWTVQTIGTSSTGGGTSGCGQNRTY